MPRISASFLIENEDVEYEGCRATLFVLPYFGTPPYHCGILSPIICEANVESNSDNFRIIDGACFDQIWTVCGPSLAECFLNRTVVVIIMRLGLSAPSGDGAEGNEGCAGGGHDEPGLPPGVQRCWAGGVSWAGLRSSPSRCPGRPMSRSRREVDVLPSIPAALRLALQPIL